MWSYTDILPCASVVLDYALNFHWHMIVLLEYDDVYRSFVYLLGPLANYLSSFIIEQILALSELERVG